MGLDTVELVMDVEREFNIKIPDENAVKILTVGEFYDFVISRLKEQGRSYDDKEVWEKLKNCIVAFGPEPDEVIPEARIVDDLKIH